MIPKANTLGILVEEEQGNDNYRMIFNDERIIGIAKNLESMKQVIFKILNTHRYKHIIYSWNYGIEIDDLYGESVEYVKIELKRRITEALIQDDRIESVEDFNFEYGENRNELVAKFTVNTIYGAVEERKVVKY